MGRSEHHLFCSYSSGFNSNEFFPDAVTRGVSHLMGFIRTRKIVELFAVLIALVSAGYASAPTSATVTVHASVNLGTIKGVVRDDGGNPIADATVAVFKAS